MARLRAAPTERIAGVAFFAFTVLQIPFFLVETPLAASGMALLSPLQVTAANAARVWPSAAGAMDAALLPGGWVREALAPLIRCRFKTAGTGPCADEQARLLDLAYVRKGNNLPLLVRLLEGGGLGEQQGPILYGCALIVVSAAFSLYASVKTAVLGFALLGYGVVQGHHVPLPPGVLTAFLCIYAGFQLGELRGNMRERAARRQGAAAAPQQQQQQQGAVVRKVEPKAGGKSSAAKQRKQHKRA